MNWWMYTASSSQVKAKSPTEAVKRSMFGGQHEQA